MNEDPELQTERRPDAPPHRRHDVGADADLAEGGILFCEIEGREIGVGRVDGRLHAVSLRCTHAAWLMNDVPLEHAEIVCSLHGARFDLRDGCPTAGPARGPLQTFAVRVRDGRIEIEVPVRVGSSSQPGPERC